MTETKKRILIVDDQPTISHFLKMCLEKSGFEVHEENNSKKAIATARTFRPDLILLDVMMPDVSGSEIAEQCKIDTLLRGTPIIFLTGIVGQEEIENEQGVVGGHPFIAKPVDINLMLVRIRECLLPQ